MKIIHARIRNGRLTDPLTRRDLDADIGRDSEACYVAVVVFDRGDGEAISGVEQLGSIMLTPSRRALSSVPSSAAGLSEPG